jgi:hypothetical protein
VMRNVVLAATLVVVASAPAQAQMLTWQDRGFVNFSAVLQSGPGDSDLNGSFELYLQTGTYQGPWDLSGGAALDLSGGIRVWRNLAVGLGYSRPSPPRYPTPSSSIGRTSGQSAPGNSTTRRTRSISRRSGSGQ